MGLSVEFGVAPESGPVHDSVQNLQDLVDHLGISLANPTILITPDFRLVAYSRHSDDADKPRQLTILHRRIPDQIVRLLHQSGNVRKMNLTQAPVRLPALPDVGLSERVVMPIRVGDRLLGNFSVQETHRILTEEDFPLLEQAAILAAIEFLRLDQHHQTQQHRIDEFLWDLIRARSPDPETVVVRAQTLSIPLPEVFVVLVAEPSNHPQPLLADREDGLRPVAALIRAVAGQSGFQTLSVFRDERVITIIGAGPESSGRPGGFAAVPEAIRTAAKEKDCHLSLGVSGQYRSVGEIPRAYAEAERALRVGHVAGWTRFVASTSNLGVLQLLPLFAETVRAHGAAEGMHSNMIRLLAEARDGLITFPALETLEAYLDAGGDAMAAAKRLCVHPNTLNYRIRRIADVVGVDLSDGMERLAIHLEMKIRRLVTTDAERRGANDAR